MNIGSGPQTEPAPHQQPPTTHTGVDIDGGPPKDLTKDGLLDVYMAKWWAIRLATEAATTILKVGCARPPVEV